MRKKWLPSEERILIKNIKKFGVIKGAEITSNKIGRSARACELHWSILGKKGVVKLRKVFKWDDDSKSLLEETLTEHPNNIREAFNEVANRLGVSPNIVINSFYRKSSPVYRDKLKFCFAVVGRNKSIYNRKISNENEVKPTIPFLRKFFKKLFSK